MGLLLSRTLSEGLHEDLDIRNYSGKHLHFILEVLVRSDFADIFEVKAKNLTRRGHIESDWPGDRQELATRYSARDFGRCLLVRLQCSGPRAVYANGRISFEIDLPTGGAWHACCKYDLVDNDRVRPAHEQCVHAHETLAVAQKMTPAELAAATHCYPTQVEAIQRIADQGPGAPRVGVIDMRAQAKVPSARRSDTPRAIRLSPLRFPV